MFSKVRSIIPRATAPLTRAIYAPAARAMAQTPATYGAKSGEIMCREAGHVAANYKPMPVVWASAKGVKVTDADGRTYIDCLSAYGATNTGHSHPKIVEALTKQASVLALSSRAFYSDKLADFAKFACGLFGFEKVLPMNTGAEAVETALKIARRHAYVKRGIKDNEAVIISACGCFHGRTMHAISMSCDPEATEHFGPLTPGHVKVRYNDLKHLEKKLEQNKGKVAAFLVEPVQGEAGVIVPSPGYLTAARELCRKHGVLFIADEVQTGVARTGKMLSVDHEGVKPDILILGKSVSGGLYPVSLVFADSAVMDVITPGSHGSTFGGNPLACAVAEAALRVTIDEKLAERADAAGKKFRARLAPLAQGENAVLTDVRGQGLLNAIELRTHDAKTGAPVNYTAYDLCLLMQSRGVLAKPTHGKVVRLSPPLVITDAELEELLAVIEGSVRDIAAMPRDKIPGAAAKCAPHLEEHCARCNSD